MGFFQKKVFNLDNQLQYDFEYNYRIISEIEKMYIHSIFCTIILSLLFI